MYLLIIVVIIIVICILFGNKKENFGCAITSCCLQGEYGTPPNCRKCPDSKPSSPRTANGAPNSSCKCPNEAASSCFACTSSCYPFVKSTGICTLLCPNCRVNKQNQHNCPSN